MMITASLAGLLVTSVYTDLSTGKVYNKITFPCMVLGVVLNTLAHGWFGFFDSLEGMGIVLLPSLLLASPRGIGGGDIKLMTAAGSFLGFHLTLWAMAFSAVIGGLLALLVAKQQSKMQSSLSNAGRILYMRLAAGVPVDQTLPAGSGIRFRYSIAIACGVIAAVLLTNRLL